MNTGTYKFGGCAGARHRCPPDRLAIQSAEAGAAIL
jgi:hypothetical protein